MKVLLFVAAAFAMTTAWAPPAEARKLTANIATFTTFTTAPPVIVMTPFDFRQSFAVPPKIIRPAKRLQCAVYARERSGVELRGAAGSWWTQAKGKFDRAAAPLVGAVMVLGGTPKGHVAVVSKVLSPVEILVDHANWMNKGEIQIGALVRDVSANNDWSAVRVWYPPSKGLGNKAYPVRGFILAQATPQPTTPDKLAMLQ